MKKNWIGRISLIVTIRTLENDKVTTNKFSIKQDCGFLIPDSLSSTQTFISNGKDIPSFDFDDFKYDPIYCQVSGYEITSNTAGIPHPSLELIIGRPNRALVIPKLRKLSQTFEFFIQAIVETG